MRGKIIKIIFIFIKKTQSIMIRKNTQFGNLKGVTILEFGKGDIQVQPAYGDGYTAVLFKTDEKTYPIGTEHETKDRDSDWFKPEIVMTFTNVEGLDVVIKKLKETRKYLIKKYPNNGR